MASTTTQRGQPVHQGKFADWVSKVFAFNPAGLNWPRAVLILDLMLVPLIVFLSIGHEEYLLSAIIGVVWTAASDPGGSYGYRALRLAIFGVLGAGLTWLAFTIGGDAWGWLVLAIFVTTVLAGLVIAFGAHRAVGGLLLNAAFLIALAVAYNEQHTHHTSHTWAQVVSWAAGSALWMVVTFVEWLIHGREDRPSLFVEMPGDTSRHPLTGPVIMYVLLRAAVLAGAAALAAGYNLNHGVWLVFGAFAAMKPGVGPTTVRSVQRLVGALIGAGVAALLLLIPANVTGKDLVGITHGLQVVGLILIMHAGATFFWNYAAFQAAYVAALLILLDVQQPTNYSALGYRLLWTLCGVAMATVLMILAYLLGTHSARESPQPAAQPA